MSVNFRSGPKKSNPQGIDVSRYGPDPWRRLSPFVAAPHPLGIPGYWTYGSFDQSYPGYFGDTVEGIWQGLKVIQGETDVALFKGRARKRRGKPEGHDYGRYRLLTYAEAKALIYIPLYLSFLHQHQTLLDTVTDAVFVDVSYQPDTLGPKPISHAALLADFLNGELLAYESANTRLLAMAERINQRYTAMSEALKVNREETLHRESYLTQELREIQGRVLELHDDGINLESYYGCARLFERENLMLLSMRCCGCHKELGMWRELPESWVNGGLLTQPQADLLLKRAPLNRWF